MSMVIFGKTFEAYSSSELPTMGVLKAKIRQLKRCMAKLPLMFCSPPPLSERNLFFCLSKLKLKHLINSYTGKYI